MTFYAIEIQNSSTIKPRKDAIQQATLLFGAMNIAQCDKYCLGDNIVKEKCIRY